MADKPVPKKPRGHAILWDDATLDAMTSPEAIEAAAESAAEFWRANASPEFKDLLDAEVVN